MVINIEQSAEVFAGNDATICEGDNYLLNDATSSYYVNINWSTSGNGTFSNQTIMNPVYTPSAQDIVNGQVILTMKATGNAPCVLEVSDDMLLVIQNQASINAGADFSSCDNSFTLAGAFGENYSSVAWTSSGTGVFNDNTILNTTYTPSAADRANGLVTLIISAQSYAPCSATATDDIIVILLPNSVADAGSDMNGCIGDVFTISTADAQNYSSMVWTTSGSGSFAGNNTITPTYTPSADDYTNGSVILTLTVRGNSPCGDVSDAMVISFVEEAVVDAGASADVCEGVFEITDATASSYSSILWTTSGDGTFVSNNVVNSTYLISDNDASSGVVFLTLTAQSNNPCSSTVSDVKTLNITPQADVFAGADTSVCGNTVYQLLDATAGSCSSLIWTTTGTGAFSNTGIANPVYTPSSDDVSNGTVLLSLTGTGTTPCSNQVSDQMILSFTSEPIVDAGIDATICEANPYTITTATATDYSVVNWSTSGSGTFINGTTLSPTYTPTAGDISSGSVILTMSVAGTGGCTNTVTDEMMLTINSFATVSAGVDASVCQGDSYSIFTATAQDYSSVEWITLGDGYFDDAFILNPVYNPGVNDIASGNVVLALTGNSVNPCNASVTDNMILSIISGASADAGSDGAVCDGSSYTISGASAINSSSVNWISSGDGIIVDANTLTPDYTPGSQDVINGVVQLSLIAQGIAPCSVADTSIMMLHVISAPTANVAGDVTLCGSDNYLITDAVASHYSSLNWTTSGTGTFINGQSIEPTYVPSDGDVVSGSVIITLEALPDAPCSGSATDAFIMNFEQEAVVDAGLDGNICETENYSLNTATASGYNSVLWTTSGDGIFVNATSVNTDYISGTNDILSGFVTLTLTAHGNAPCTTEVSDNIVLSITQESTIIFDNGVSLCDGNNLLDISTITNYSSVMWTTTGTGTLVNPNTLIPTYITSAGDVANGSVGFTVTVQPVNPCSVAASSTILMDILTPEAYAGVDANICETENYPLSDATAVNYTSLEWSTTGTGTFSDVNILHAIYYPSENDRINGNVELTLNLYKNNCSDISDVMNLTFSPLPDVDAGIDAVICETGLYNTNSAQVANETSLLWTTSGTGAFVDATLLNTIYTPSTQDINNGSVVLTLTAQSNAPCTSSVADMMILNINKEPTVDAGLDTIVCENQSYHIQGAGATNYSSLLWTTSGNGTFSNMGILDPVYTPSAADAAIGNVALTLTALQEGCGSISDNIAVQIVPEPTVNAGGDATISGGTTYPITLATVSNETSITWSTSGTGSFDDNTIINPVYTPTAYDISQGSVVLTVEVVGDSHCNNLSDNMTLSIVLDPGVDFTFDNGCATNPVQFYLTPTTDTAALVSYTWDFGDGSFSSQKEPIHTFAIANDYNVQLTVVDTVGYSTSISHIVEVHSLPNAYFDVNEPICVGNPVQFNDYSTTTSGYINSWHWDFGDGSDTTIVFPANPNVTHIYDNSITYNVTLTVETSQGCINAIIIPVSTVPSPVAMFDYDETCEGLETQFTDLSVSNGGGNIISWMWSFDDPMSGATNTSTLQNPTHAFSADGNYDVSLIVSNTEGCLDTISQTITVSPTPEVEFIFQHTCLDEVTYFFADTAIIVEEEVTQWQWDFGDGESSNLQDPEHYYNVPGSYDVTLTIHTTAGCVNSVVHTVNVEELPIAQFDFNTPACNGYEVEFLDYSSSNSGYITSWLWEFGDGNDTLINFPDNPNVEHLYALLGTYNITLTVTNVDGCSDVQSRQVTVEPNPVANFDFENTCQNEAVVFTDLSQTNGAGVILSWNWDFGDPLSGINNTSQLQNPSHVYSAVGNYTTTLTIETVNGCSSTYSREVAVSETPAVDFDYVTSCLNDTTHFNSSNYVNGRIIDSYYWEFGDGGNSDVADPGYVYTTEGIYSVQLTVIDTAGCSNTVTHDVEITPLPVPAFTFSGNTCSNAAVQFVDQSYSGSGAINQWIWDFGDGTDTTITFPQIPDVGHQYANNGNYTVTLTIIDEFGCSDFIEHQVNVLASPAAEFSFDGGCLNEVVSFTDQSITNGGTAITGWTWNFDDPISGINNQSTLQNPTHFFTEADTFNVQLIISNTNGCMDTIFHQVGVSAPPAVAIEANDISCQGIEMQFRPDTLVTDTAAIAIFDWYFGDGSDHVYGQNPLHTFELAGQYQVTLTVTDTVGCVNETAMLVVVDETPTPNFSYELGCVGGLTQFTDYSFTNSGTAIIQWLWDFGDANALPENNVSIDQNPEHLYSEAGTYNVKLVVSSANGCQDSIIMDVIVNPSPQAWFVYDTATCQDGLVYFQDSTTSENSTIVSWQWQFEEGYQSNLQNPTYTFSQSDDCYDVQLISYDALGCSDTAIRTVCVPVGFAVDFESTNTCLNDTTYFSDSLVSPIGDSIILVSWNFGDPGSGAYNISTEHNPSHYYEHSGSYNVILEATNINNCTYIINHTVDVFRLPEPAFSYNSYLCDSTVYFKNESIGNGATIIEWVWSYGDGSLNDTILASGNPDVNHVYNDPGEYEVILQVTNGNGCVNIFSDTIFREPCLTADFELLDDTICHTRSINFADSSIIRNMITQWDWDFGDGEQESYSIYHSNISHVFADTGTFDVSLTVRTVFNGYDREDTYVMPVTVHPTPYAQFIANDICFADSVLFIDNTSADSANIVAWDWDFGMVNINTDTSTSQNPYYQYSNYGEYLPRLVVTNEYGCSDTLNQSVLVHQLPTAAFSIDNSCRGDATYFYDDTDTIGFVGEMVKWHWDFGIEGIRTDTSDIQNADFVYRNEGNHNVTLIVTDEFGCVDSVIKPITTNPIPTAAFSLEDDYENMQGRFNLTNESSEYNEYEWNFGTLPYHYDQEYHIDDEDPVIVYEDDGIYDIQLIVWNEFNCPDTIVLTDSLLFKGLFIPTAFSPNNPYQDVRTFDPTGINLIEYHIQVYGVRGNLIWQSDKLDEEGSPTEVWDGTYDGVPLPEGVYVWKVRALFKDGTSWQGKSVGAKELSSGERYGTVTLIR
ncbi:MAG: PKD domain-containing protein [Bacteroidota bacterium]|nr:PKD domain-containing protein [Bacteroidota bacterium]